ncbi:DUF1501 domain-containing protein [Akkermansiaceae bacterium]|nr:DUF1501 domain-containing protein [Akkermansiaceae bacterium]MDA7927079.1 DUF1501 domain-containing protein [Akkermansiaceae bacterium]MDA8974266.1 DUF1501 domain-containing protein [Akkermansiaceae bacterium]
MSTLLSLKMANNAVAADLPTDSEDRKTLVCLYLHGGIDSYNILIPNDTSRYAEYAATRTNLALARQSLLPLSQAANGDGQEYAIHPAMGGLQELFNGNGAPEGTRRLSFISNIGTLIEPMTKSEYKDRVKPRPRGLFSHSDQAEQWQTSLPQGDVNLTGWAGRVADILHDQSNGGSKTSMSISLAGNNIFQVGRDTQQFVMTSRGALTFSQKSGANHPTALKNLALRSMMEQSYANLMEKAFAELTDQSLGQQEFIQGEFDSLREDFSGVVFPDSGIGRNLLATLKTIALRAKLGLRRQTIFVSRGGWDHHSSLIQPQQNLLAELTPALTAFQKGLENCGLADSVITFSASDFARTLRSNGSGSDHAWGGNQFVMGGPVAGGQVLGRYPSLAFDSADDVGRGGRILPTTSVDALVAELLLWFGLKGRTNFEQILPNLSNFYDARDAEAHDPSTLPIGFLKPDTY